MVVLEELDRAKKGVSEVTRNVRQASRSLAEIIARERSAGIEAGLPLIPPREDARIPARGGRLFFQTRALAQSLPVSLPSSSVDNTILATTLALQQNFSAHSLFWSPKISIYASRLTFSVFMQRTIITIKY